MRVLIALDSTCVNWCYWLKILYIAEPSLRPLSLQSVFVYIPPLKFTFELIISKCLLAFAAHQVPRNRWALYLLRNQTHIQPNLEIWER